MPIRLATFADQPEHEIVAELSGVQFRLRFVWRPRLSSWYLDVRELDGTAVALGRRLSPGFGPLAGLSLPAGPTGVLYVEGPEPYRQTDLGGALSLVYYGPDELPTAAADNNPVTVVVS